MQGSWWYIHFHQMLKGMVNWRRHYYDYKYLFFQVRNCNLIFFITWNWKSLETIRNYFGENLLFFSVLLLFSIGCTPSVKKYKSVSVLNALIFLYGCSISLSLSCNKFTVESTKVWQITIRCRHTLSSTYYSSTPPIRCTEICLLKN